MYVNLFSLSDINRVLLICDRLSLPDDDGPVKLVDLIFTAPDEITTGEVEIEK